MIPPLLARWVHRPGRPSPRTSARSRSLPPRLERLEDRVALAIFTLSNGPGEATVSVGVDGYGSFGSSAGFESAVAINFLPFDESKGDARFIFLSSGHIGRLPNPPVTGS